MAACSPSSTTPTTNLLFPTIASAIAASVRQRESRLIDPPHRPTFGLSSSHHQHFFRLTTTTSFLLTTTIVLPPSAFLSSYHHHLFPLHYHRRFFRLASTTSFLSTTTIPSSLFTTMSAGDLYPAICECQSLVNRTPLNTFMAGALFALLVALFVLRFGRPPRTTSIRRLRRWVRISVCRVHIRGLYDRQPTPKQIRELDPLARVAAVAEFPDSYANDGLGAIYVVAVVDDDTLEMFISGRISAANFLLKVRVKLGETSDLPLRQLGYKKCNGGQTHFWLFCFYPDKRKASEKMCHALFQDDAPPALLKCSCAITHKEYWWLRELGGFAKVEERVRDVLALRGQHDLVR
ncbi:hypothetical protein B0H16DRAFT_838935 [Mycena metata]|nr:hypothetical protein B0H16DRAFT_838935 [Mycena metata]